MSEHKPFITIYKCVAGWKAQHVVWNDDEDGRFWDIWNTSYFAYATPQEAEVDAIDWANSEGLEYKRPANVPM